MVELKACPFCGGEAFAENYIIEAAVRCLDCRAKIIRSHAQLGDTGLPEAIIAWNTRPHPAPLDLDARARLARRLHVLDEPIGETMSLSWEDLLEGTQERYLAYADCALKAALAERPVVDAPRASAACPICQHDQPHTHSEKEQYEKDPRRIRGRLYALSTAIKEHDPRSFVDDYRFFTAAGYQGEPQNLLAFYSRLSADLDAILALLQPGVASVEGGEAFKSGYAAALLERGIVWSFTDIEGALDLYEAALNRDREG